MCIHSTLPSSAKLGEPNSWRTRDSLSLVMGFYCLQFELRKDALVLCYVTVRARAKVDPPTVAFPHAESRHSVNKMYYSLYAAGLKRCACTAAFLVPYIVLRARVV